MTWFDLYKILLDSCKKAGAGKYARNEALNLLIHFTGFSYSELMVNFNCNAPAGKIKKILSIAKKRADFMPVAYLTGTQPFMEYEIIINKGVFIPRQDTEILINAVKNEAVKIKRPLKFVECGCGSGNIAVALCGILDNIKVYDAIDISEKAFKNTLANVLKYNLSNVIRPVKSDFFKWWHMHPFEYDFLVSNPPYISHKEYLNLDGNVKKEPKNALIAAENGLIYYRKMAEFSKKLLKPGSIIAIEIGWKQAKAVDKIFINNGFKKGFIYKDYCGRDRAITYTV